MAALATVHTAMPLPLHAAAASLGSTDAAAGTPSGLTLPAARTIVATCTASVQSAYSQLIELDSCTAVEPLPDCLDAAGAQALTRQLIAACDGLLAALPVVGADVAYSGAPARRRAGVAGLLDSLERSIRKGGASVDVADLEWVEEVEGRTNEAVDVLRALRDAVRLMEEEAMATAASAVVAVGKSEAGNEADGVSGVARGRPVGAVAGKRRELQQLCRQVVVAVRAVTDA
ncbi:hypothetical protein GPECTOR_1g881 [Gonium pectorale]|uniref:Uncharacterized protein n=1 Tax=Gonium pectorale TaxID=33097 RepID=A0A150H4C3_GONPE|nr:hypothetical protein GPECTOR_1g881 [Gonium pectorale]|eukprot:KXZ56976.1 hypothetical protein GPECTOR_1g881 [Gonium pectorale]